MWHNDKNIKFCEQCKKHAKQLGKELDCTTCEGKPPDLLENNIKFLKKWELLNRSFNYASTMDAVFPTGLNWSNVESILRLFHIFPTRTLLKRIRLAENLTIQQATESLKKE